MRYICLAAALLTCSACGRGGGNIDGQYSGPNGARLNLAGDRYEFCEYACTAGRVEIRPSSKRSGRITFYGVPVRAFFRDAQRGPASSVRTWGDGVETNYSVGLFGDASIEVSASQGLFFKRRN